MLKVEQLVVSLEQMVLSSLSAKARPAVFTEVNSCNAKTLFIVCSFRECDSNNAGSEWLEATSPELAPASGGNHP